MSILYGSVQLELSADRRLVGRETEMTALLDACRRVKEIGSSELVIIKGSAGVGKTTLLQKLQESAQFDPRVFCARGTSLKEALSSLCDLVLEADDMLGMCSKIDDVITGDERQAMVELIPKIGEILGESTHDPIHPAIQIPLDSALLKPVLCRVMKSICSRQHPVVLVLDDLHQCNPMSLELIQALASCVKLRWLMLVLSFRDKSFSCDIKAGPNSLTVQTNIAVGNLDNQNVNMFLSQLLEMDPASTTDLASAVYSKTHGNMKDVIDFMGLIEGKTLIKFQLSSCRWVWDTQRIIEETSCSDSLADELVENMGRLSESTKKVLKNAACLGMKVRADILDHIMTEKELFNPQDGLDGDEGSISLFDDENELTTLEVLESLVLERLLEKSSELHYKFCHERVLDQAYLWLANEEERARLHLRVGELLWEGNYISDDVEDAEALFSLTNHFNKAKHIITDPAKKFDLAKLNLEAGERAMSISAFIPAADYFQIGISLLPKTKWTDHYEVCLRLHTVSADAEYCTGKFAPSSARARAVLQHGRSVQDKIPSYITIVQSLGAQKHFSEAMELGFLVLDELGERLPKNVHQPRLLAESMRTKRALRKFSNERLLSLPVLTDENKIAAMRIINEMSLGALYTKKGEWLPFLMFRMIGWTLELGICKEAACAFATYGALLCGPLKDMDEGVRMGKLSQNILDRSNCNDLKTRVNYWVYSCVNHWRAPLTESLDPLLTCYRTGMACGNINYALQGSAMYCTTYLWSGLPLVPIEADMRSYCSEMKSYMQESGLAYAQTTWQYALNMMGKSADPIKLQGEAMDYIDVLSEALETNNALTIAHVRLMRMMLAYHFGDIELAADICRAQRRNTRSYQALHELVIFEFFSGLVLFSLAGKTRSRKHLRRARKSLNRMKKWSKTCGNCLHMLTLLRAEDASLKYQAKPDDVRKAYSAAISMAGRSGFLQDCALSNERAGLYCVSLEDYDWASHYLTKAHSQYLDYGATAKARSMQSQFDSLISEPENTTNNINLRGRRRFSGRSSSCHRRISASSLRRGSEMSGASTGNRRISASSFSSLRSSGSGAFSFGRSSESGASLSRRLSEGEDEGDVSDLDEMFSRSVPIDTVF
jgi:histidine kinase